MNLTARNPVLPNCPKGNSLESRQGCASLAKFAVKAALMFIVDMGRINNLRAFNIQTLVATPDTAWIPNIQVTSSRRIQHLMR